MLKNLFIRMLALQENKACYVFAIFHKTDKIYTSQLLYKVDLYIYLFDTLLSTVKLSKCMEI